MGRRGPQPKPTALKLERGVPGHHKLNHDEPELPKPATLKPPKGMTGKAKQEWIRLADMLVERGVLTEGDMDAFEEYCYLVGDVDEYRRLAKRVGPSSAVSLGYAGALNKLRTQKRQQAAHLGLTSTSRSGVKAVKVEKKDAAAAKREKYFGKAAS